MRRFARIADALLWVSAAIGLAAMAATAVMWLTAARPLVVSSGSMDPAYPVRSVTLVHRIRASEIRAGDVLALTLPTGQRVMHRVVERDVVGGQVRIRTKGDANRTPDPEPVMIPDTGTVWRAGASVPALGALVAALHTPLAGFVLALALLGPIALGRGRRPSRRAEPLPA